MSEDVLELIIKKYLSTPQPVYTFAWQGGEPTLMGRKFFRQIAEFQTKYARPNSRIINALQTNGTLITLPLAKHLARHRFLVGVSLDGPPKLHNRYRRYANGRNSHAAALRGIALLRQEGVEFNILILVSKANVHEAVHVYEYLLKQGFYYHQYIPCVEFDQNGNLMPFSITSEEWGQFLCALFDRWYERDIYSVSIRNFDDIVNKMSDGTISSCNQAGNCCHYFVIEYNGDIYPCDFFVEKDLYLGNISDTIWKDALSSPVYQKFGSQKSDVHPVCRNCEFFDLCVGDCLKHRNKGGRADSISHLCKGWKAFFNHSHQSFINLTRGMHAN